MPECDTRLRGTGQADIGPLIDAHLNSVIAAARAATGNNGPAMVRQVYAALGEPLSLNPMSSNFNVSGIENWVAGQAPMFVNRITQPASKFAGLTYRLWPDNRILAPTLLVYGHWIGADKLGHFFQQGWQYYDLVARGFTLAQAEQWGHETEAGLGYPPGWSTPADFIPQPFGLLTTGVYSRADREVNRQGYNFYAWLSAAPAAGFTISSYVNRRWSEENNASHYHADVVESVWSRIISGAWNGSFTIFGDPANPTIQVTVQLARAAGASSVAAGTPVSGRFDYTYNSGPVWGSINGTLRYLPAAAGLGYRSVRLDYSWRSGANTGRGQWRSAGTENRLTGSWGWNASSTDGGRFDVGR